MTLQEYLDKNYTKRGQHDLTRLYCSYEGISSLEGIENCNNLKTLYCDNNDLTSLKGIEHCIKLEVLYCYNNALTNLKGIENLTNLENLSCENNVIKEIDLSNNKKLRFVLIDKSVKLLNSYNYKINQLIIS